MFSQPINSNKSKKFHACLDNKTTAMIYGRQKFRSADDTFAKIDAGKILLIFCVSGDKHVQLLDDTKLAAQGKKLRQSRCNALFPFLEEINCCYLF